MEAKHYSDIVDNSEIFLPKYEGLISEEQSYVDNALLDKIDKHVQDFNRTKMTDLIINKKQKESILKNYGVLSDRDSLDVFDQEMQDIIWEDFKTKYQNELNNKIKNDDVLKLVDTLDYAIGKNHFSLDSIKKKLNYVKEFSA